MKEYTYYSLIMPTRDTGWYYFFFPDFPMLHEHVESIEEARRVAKEDLKGCIECRIEDEDECPSPRSLEQVKKLAEEEFYEPDKIRFEKITVTV